MRRRSRFALVGLASLLVLAFVMPVATSAASGNGKIRAFHDSPDTPAVDIWVNGAPALTNVTYGTVSDYLTVPKGDYLIEVKVAPSTAHDPAALSKTVYVGKRPVTVAAIGSLTGDGGALGLKVLRDQKGVGGNWSLVRVAHTSPDAPAVDVQVRFGKRWIRVVDDISFGEKSGYIPLPARNPFTGRAIKWDIRLVVAGTSTVVLKLNDTKLPRNRALTVWAVGFVSPVGDLPGFGVQVTPDGRNAF